MSYSIKEKRNEIIAMQCLTTGLMGIGICSYLLKEINRIDIKSFLLVDIVGKSYYILALLGGIVWLIYLIICKKEIEIISHIILIFCLVCRVIFLVNECCFGGEVPAYTIVFLGFPSAISFLTEINLLVYCLRGYKLNKVLVKLNIIVTSIIAVSWSISFAFMIIEGYTS